MRRRAAIALALIALIIPSAARPGVNQALAQQPAAVAEVEPSVGLTVGDPITIRIRITHEPGARVLLDGSLVEMGAMEPAAAAISTVDAAQTLIVLQTRAFATGAFTVALPAIPIRSTAGSLSEVAVAPFSIRVGSVLGDDAQPRPNTAPDLLDDDPQTFTPWIVAIIGIGLGFIAARIARRRRRRRASSESRAAPAAVHEPEVGFALDETLDAAEQCRQLAAAVRLRLSRDWSLPAAALTTSEIGPALAAAGAPGVVVLRVARLLEACDRAQFGGEQPTPERLRGYLQLAEAIWEDGESA